MVLVPNYPFEFSFTFRFRFYTIHKNSCSYKDLDIESRPSTHCLYVMGRCMTSPAITFLWKVKTLYKSYLVIISKSAMSGRVSSLTISQGVLSLWWASSNLRFPRCMMAAIISSILMTMFSLKPSRLKEWCIIFHMSLSSSNKSGN